MLFLGLTIAEWINLAQAVNAGVGVAETVWPILVKLIAQLEADAKSSGLDAALANDMNDYHKFIANLHAHYGQASAG